MGLKSLMHVPQVLIRFFVPGARRRPWYVLLALAVFIWPNSVGSVQAAAASCPGATFVIPADGKIGWSYRWPDSAPGSSPPHTGIDILGNAGDDVYAASDGVVIQASSPRVMIRHQALRVDTYYTHLSRIDTTVGATVARGAKIGQRGSVGTTVTHLHFSVVKWPSVDPANNQWRDEQIFANTLNPSSYLGGNVDYAAGATDYGARSVAERCLSSAPHALGRPDLAAWCRSQGFQGIGTTVNNAYGLRCVTQGQPPAVMSVLDACKSQFGARAVDIMRNFNDPYDWQCYDTAKELGAPNLGDYCRSMGYSDIVAVDATAYGLRCAAGSRRDTMSVYHACQLQFGRIDVIDSMRNFNDPQDWKCWSIN